MAHWALPPLVIAVMVALGGCSDAVGPTSSVEGTVTIDGNSVEAGLVTFTPLESGKGKAATTEIQDGHYHAEAVPRGKVLVRFQARKETGETVTQLGEEYPVTVSIVPRKYETGMEIELAAEEESHDFALTSK